MAVECINVSMSWVVVAFRDYIFRSADELMQFVDERTLVVREGTG